MSASSHMQKWRTAKFSRDDVKPRVKVTLYPHCSSLRCMGIDGMPRGKLVVKNVRPRTLTYPDCFNVLVWKPSKKAKGCHE